MGKLSEWLDVMLGEISRKQGEAAVSAAEQQRRDAEQSATGSGEQTPSPTAPTAERR